MEALSTTHRIEVSVAVDGLSVCDSVPFLGWLTECFREHRPFFDKHGRLSFLCGEALAGDTDEVSKIDELLEEFVFVFPQILFLEGDLELACVILERCEGEFTHLTKQDDSSRDFQRCSIFFCASFLQGVGSSEVRSVRISAERTEFLRFVETNGIHGS